MGVARAFLGLYSGKPHNPVADDGRMALTDHFRELRARLLRGLTALVIALVLFLFLTDQLLALVSAPYYDAMARLGETPKEVDSKLVINDVGGPLLLQLKLAGVAGLLASSPVWLYQVWAFILPGLHKHERRWTLAFVAVAGPLFLAGAAVGYYVLPKGLEALVGFTPAGVENLVEFGNFFTFIIRMMFVFGISFEIPLFILLLNLAGVLPGHRLKEYRPWAIVGIFVFAAVGTPSTDPISMLFLALPMTVLYLVSEVISRLLDRRKARAVAVGPADDEASVLP